MPQVPTIRGQAPPRVVTQPSIPDSALNVAAKANEAVIEPEPAIRVEDFVPPSQEELAARGLAQQTVTKRNSMTPLISPTPKETPKEPEVYPFTDEDRKKAAEVRAAKKYDWDNSPLEDALAYLALIRVECERGGLALQTRISQLKVETVKCFSCDNIINIGEGRFAGMRTRSNFETGIPESAYACSAACYLKLQRDFVHPVAIRG